MAERSLVEEWIQVHRRLMAQEAEFTGLALRAARGEVRVEELEAARARLLAMREECNAAYGKAFPKGDRGAAD